MLNEGSIPEAGDTAALDAIIETVDRRRAMRRAGLGLAGLAAAGILARSSDARAATAPSDVDIFNFALNFEYLGSEYYLRGVTGHGTATYAPVTSAGTTIGAQGVVTGGNLVPFRTRALAYYAQQLANDELGHVLVIREALAAEGAPIIAEPTIDLTSNSWTNLAVSAGLLAPGQTFNPYADEVSFLLGAYVLEDVCVTALAGAAALLTNPTNIAYAASLLGAESYQAGAIRGFLANIGADTATDAISALRAKLSGVGDVGTGGNGNPFNITNVDVNAQAFRRTPSQVLSIAYGTNTPGSQGGLFFPNGVNGTNAALRVV